MNSSFSSGASLFHSWQSLIHGLLVHFNILYVVFNLEVGLDFIEHTRLSHEACLFFVNFLKGLVPEIGLRRLKVRKRTNGTDYQ